MLSIRLEQGLESRLNALSSKTHRPKSFYVTKALEQYLEDLEDTYIALDRIMHPDRKYLSSAEVLDRLKAQK